MAAKERVGVSNLHREPITLQDPGQETGLSTFPSTMVRGNDCATAEGPNCDKGGWPLPVGPLRGNQLG